MIHIICPQSRRYKSQVESICKYVELVDYEILDPLSHDLDRPFSFLMVLGSPRFNIVGTPNKIWQAALPDQSMTETEKKAIIGTFKEAKAYLSVVDEPKVFTDGEIPPLKDFAGFFKNLNAEIVEVTLPDGRKLGIYPDNMQLRRKFDVEYKASTIINMSKIKDLFGVKEIIIKEI